MKQLAVETRKQIEMKSMPAQISKLIEGIEKAYATIRKYNPDAGEALIVVYQPPKGTTKMGHFWRGSWFSQGEEGERKELDEILISSHILVEGADAVLETLLHEAVHSIAKTRGIQDTSRQNRWHNNRFRKLAHEVGLTTEPHKSIGCTTGSLDAETEPLYEEAIEIIDDVLTVFQDLKSIVPLIKKPRKKLYVTAECGCGHTIRVKPVVLDITNIGCETCGEDFMVL